MNNDLSLISDSVKESMLIPVWGRSTYSKLYPELLYDRKAIELIENINLDFESLENYPRKNPEYFGIVFLVRGRNMDDACKKYLLKYEKATVVNLGCGLDTTFERIDNGKIIMYNIDLPDAIKFRTKILPPSERNRNISKSVMNFTWMDEIDYSKENGVFFIAGGLFMYFKEEQLQNLFKEMSNRFPDGEMIFDGSSKLGLKIGNKAAKETGKTEMIWHYATTKPKKTIAKWSKKIEILDFYSYWERTPINKIWSKYTRKIIRIVTLLKLGNFTHIRFLS